MQSNEARRRRLRVLAVVATLLVAATLTQPLTGLPVIPERTAHAFGCPTPITIVNGAFDNPVLPANNATTPPGWTNLGLGGWYIPDAQVPGWSTTASDGLFELWKSGRRGVPAVTGAQLAELNAQVPGTVFQSIGTSTLQGQTIQYAFWHRGRNGVDTMKIEIGPTGGIPNFTRQVSTGNTAWVEYSGSYDVPVGQTSTRFGYGAVSAVGGATQGNFIDGIRFGTPPCATDLAVSKTAAPDVYLPGQPVTFTIAITNTGAFPGQYDVVGAQLADTVPAAITGVTWTCAASTGSSCTAVAGSGNAINTTYNILEGGTVTYTVTGTAPISGTPTVLSNTATVTLPPAVTELDPSNNTSTAEIPIGEAGLSLVKSSDGIADLAVGNVITYTFSVTNTGTVALSDVTVTDPLPGLSPIDCDGDNVVAELAPGDRPVECTATYTVTQTDVDNGTLTNTATVTAVPPPNIAPPPPVTGSTTSPFDPAPALSVAKSSNAVEPVAAGNAITYSFAVTNTGNITLTDVTVSDPLLGLSAIDCGGDGDNVITSFAPGGPVTCTATYTVTQADVDSGGIANTVAVSGTPVTGGADVTGTDDLVIDTVDPAPAVSVVKTADVTEPAVGDSVTYSFDVANTGNVTLTGVRVTDPLAGLSPVNCGGGTNLIATLAPANSPVTCTATYTVTQADVDRGGITNTATVTGTPPPGSPPLTPAESGTAVPITRLAGLSLVKSSDGIGDLVVGNVTTYTFSVSNTGNVTLGNVTVTDPLPDLSAIDCDGDNVISALSPASPPVECTATYTVTQADVDAGTLTNTATATGTPPPGLLPPSDSASTTIPFDPAPALILTKTADAPDPVTVGDVIDYSFAVANSGNVTLTDVTVTDALAGLSPIDCGGDGDEVIESLAPGGPVTCTATYTVTQADVDNGVVANSATATGTPPPGSPPLTPSIDTVDVPIDRQPALSLVKSSDRTTALVAGDVITYEFTITNTGNVALADVTITDQLPDLSPISCAGGTNVIATIVPGANVECVATYTITQDNVDDGVVQNTATVTGTPPAGLDPPSASSTKNSPFDPLPSIELVKTADFTAPLSAGDEVTYTIAVTNSGNVSLAGITVSDPLAGLSPIDCGDGTAVIGRMPPGGPRLCTATYTVSQDDIDGGGVTNTASVTGQPPLGLPPVTDDSTVDVPIAPQAALSLVKSSDAVEPVAAGDGIAYSFEVTNLGNVTLSDVTVGDPLIGGATIDCDGDNVIDSLDPDDSATCTATYTVTQTDVDSGNITNVASATGTPPGSDQPLTPVNDTVTVDAEQISALTLEKSSDAGPDVAVGDEITYSFTVENTGTVTLSDVTVSDPLVGLSGSIVAAVHRPSPRWRPPTHP